MSPGRGFQNESEIDKPEHEYDPWVNMDRNIEIKASIGNPDTCLEIAKSLSGGDPEVIRQEDYFFHCENGRLKLRIFSADRGELIFYTRNNEAGPKTSEYVITKTDEPANLLHVLKQSYGIRGTVKKIRKLFVVGRTRIHIDQVEHLGDFLEFEVVLHEEEDTALGMQEAQKFMSRFEIKEASLIDCAYMDLIDKRKS